MSSSNQLRTAFQSEITLFPSREAPLTSIAPQQTYVRVPQNNSSWIIQLNDRFNELTSLPFGWDGYNGIPVSFNCAQFAGNLIERLCCTDGVYPPQLVPGSDGTLQIEWHENQYDIEIDILAPYKVIASRFDIISQEEEEFELEADYSLVAEWIHELGQHRTHLEQEVQEV